MIKIKKHVTFLYLLLFAGVFNDILRIPGTQITLFRIMLPFAVFLTLLNSTRARKLLVCFLILTVVSFFQSLLFCSFNDCGVSFDLSRYLTYLFYYACIFTVIGAVVVIWEKEEEQFSIGFERFIIIAGVSYLLVFMAIRHIESARNVLNINNQNDYGAMLAMLIPFLYYLNKRIKKGAIALFVLLIMLYIYLNDCKLALLGTVFQIMLIVYFEMRRRMVKWRALLLVPGVFILIGLYVLLYYSNLSINGYDWRQAVLEPARAMISGKLYEQSNTSITYRVNTFIVSIRWMLKTKFLGIGIGNSGVLIRNVLSDHVLYENWMLNNAVSLHNAFLEVLLEFGVVAIFGMIIVIRMIRKALKEVDIFDEEYCFVVTSVSSLLWLQGPSGILVDYFIFIMFTFMILRIKSIRKGYVG